MRRNRLSEFVAGVAFKRLRAVEVKGRGSNQHEFNATRKMKELFGDADRREESCRYVYLNDDEEPLIEEGIISWYDSRRNKRPREEWRLYYFDNAVTDRMAVEDGFFAVAMRSGKIAVVVAKAGSSVLEHLMALFGIEENGRGGFLSQLIGEKQDAEIPFTEAELLQYLGDTPEDPERDILDSLIEPFGATFPEARILSDLARRSLAAETSPLEEPDRTLVDWIERENRLFNMLERRVVEHRLRQGFCESDRVDIDGFLSFSLSVQNRRKSRAGRALESHIAALLETHCIAFERNAVTENNNKPDFLFPGAAAYHDHAFPEELLTMLGAKFSLKDRWRQVLAEADRIPVKHLLTLDQDISPAQLGEISMRQVRLVIPSPLQIRYKEAHRSSMLKVSAFLQLVRERQERADRGAKIPIKIGLAT